jgi:hypothetical protein
MFGTAQTSRLLIPIFMVLEATMTNDQSQNKNPPKTEEKKLYEKPTLIEFGNLTELIKFDVSVNA